MSRLSILALLTSVLAAGCGSDNPTTPTTTTPQNKFVFTAAINTANERPNPITNAEAGGSGTSTMTMNVTRDSSNAITAATVDFDAKMSGFPPGTILTAGHIHIGDANTAGAVVISTNIAAGEVTMPNGSGTLFKAAQPVVPVDLANQIINNPAGFYFNVHTALNPGGVARGQLVKAQ